MQLIARAAAPCLAAVFFLTAWPASSPAATRAIGPIEITVGRLDAVLPFYTNALSFELHRITKTKGQAAEKLLALPAAETRSAELGLGDERIVLTEFLSPPGRPVPPDSRSNDHWFQHIAIVVRDMDTAYARLREHQVRHVSTAPQTLPAWNKDAGGIKAFYFRDPENHVLEILWFPPGKGDEKWRRLAAATDAPLFLGVDHTAIVVSDTERSLAFYRDALGLDIAGTAENYGTEQEHLNQVFGARVRITALRAGHGPGIEFLEYITPPGGRPWPGDVRANDLVFWRTHVVAGHLRFLQDGRGGMHARPVSTSAASGSFIVRDPDGHPVQIDVPQTGRVQRY